MPSGLYSVGRLGVLVLWPNVICYVRAGVSLAAVGIGACAWTSPFIVAGIYTAGMALDGIDGVVARVLKQESEFGAALDVLVDITCRGAMWMLATRGPLGIVPVLLEMTVFVCTHAEGGGAWKIGCFAGAPPFVAAVMRNGFRSPLGAATIAGLHFLPLWIWLTPQLPPGHLRYSLPLGVVLVGGRVAAAIVEVWVILRHANTIIVRDAVSLAERKKGTGSCIDTGRRY
mmetsp:Transcript_15418/g.42457  ORF Transcript_15418/g.42457 Transcript_15418/m.42457 type:complete len:229 (+) Transcript_15418:86-772(+)